MCPIKSCMLIDFLCSVFNPASCRNCAQVRELMVDEVGLPTKETNMDIDLPRVRITDTYIPDELYPQVGAGRSRACHCVVIRRLCHSSNVDSIGCCLGCCLPGGIWDFWHICTHSL
jgi:hypothetical protein